MNEPLWFRRFSSKWFWEIVPGRKRSDIVPESDRERGEDSEWSPSWGVEEWSSSWEVEEWTPERWRSDLLRGGGGGEQTCEWWHASSAATSPGITRGNRSRENYSGRYFTEQTDLYFSMGQLTGMCVLAEFLNTNFSHKLGRKRTFYKTEKNK